MQMTSPASAPAPPTRIAKHTEEDLQSISKICMEAKSSQEGPRQRPLKVRPPDFYCGKLHMECYHFYQQCEDHFDTAGATGLNQTSFAAFFFRDRVSFCWHQHKRLAQDGVASLSWVDCKAFLRKNLGDSEAFVDTIWSSVKRDSQYQQEEGQDWASHLEHLQAIIIEFDADGASDESALIWFFREMLKPSVKTQMEQRGGELDSWDEMVEKAIDAKAKTSLQPPLRLAEWINVAPEVIVPPIPLRASFKPYCLRILAMNPLRLKSHRPKSLVTGPPTKPQLMTSLPPLSRRLRPRLRLRLSISHHTPYTNTCRTSPRAMRTLARRDDKKISQGKEGAIRPKTGARLKLGDPGYWCHYNQQIRRSS